MRNLKRALSLTLASVMLLGMMVVGSSAAGFPDVTEEDNVEAIEVLKAVEVMIGDDNGNFGPNDPVNRSQMAVVMAKLLNLDYQYYESSCIFWDVPTWARGYVGACYAKGIVSGYGGTTYGAADTVTAVQAASMMMRALGYFQHAEDYKGGFELATVSQGTDIGIFKGVGSSATAPMTRNQVAQMALNALQSEMVTFTGTPGVTIGDATVGYRAEYTPRTSTEIKYQAIEKRTSDVSGGNNLNRGQYYIQLGEELYDGKLKLRDDLDAFVRPARHWEYDGKDIGTYVKKELIKQEYVGEVVGKDLYDLLGKSTIEDYDLSVALDGVTDPVIVREVLGYDGSTVLESKHNQDYIFDKADLNRNNKGTVGGTGTGVLTQVFVDDQTEDIYVAVINTYLALADKDYDTKKEELSVKAYSITKNRSEYVKKFKDGEATQIFKLSNEDFNVEGLSKNTPMLLTIADGEVQTAVPAEVLSAVTVSSFKRNSNVVVDGTKYDFTTTAGFKAGPEHLKSYTDQDSSAIVNLKDTVYNVYLDTYGNLIGVEEVDPVKNYVFIAGIEVNDSNLTNKNVDASALFLDGTVDTIRVNMGKSDMPSVEANAANNDVYRNSILNTWCTYTVNDSGIYTLTEVVYADDLDAIPGGKDNKTKTAQVHQYMDNSDSDKNFEIDQKHIALKGRDDANTKSGELKVVYGNEDTVYLTAELGKVINGGTWGVIKGVDTRTVGVENANATVWNGENSLKAANQTKPTEKEIAGEEDTSKGVYTLYNNDGIVIGAVMVGEDNGAAKNLVYVHSGDVNSESYNGSSSSKAAGDGMWTWTRDVIMNGEEVTLTEVSDSDSALRRMNQYYWYQVKLNGDGEVIDAFKIDKDYSGDPANLEEANLVNLKDFTVDPEKIEETINNGKETVLFFSNEKIHDSLSMNGRTLYVVTTTHTGFVVDKNVKYVLQQWNNNKTDTIISEGQGAEGLKSVISEINQRYGTLNGVQNKYDYRVSAILKNGIATSVVIWDDNNDYERPSGNYGLRTMRFDVDEYNLNDFDFILNDKELTRDDFTFTTVNGVRVMELKVRAEDYLSIRSLDETFAPTGSFKVGDTRVTVNSTGTRLSFTVGDESIYFGQIKNIENTTEEITSGNKPVDPAKKYYKVTFTGDNFTTDAAEKYEENTEVKITITANNGYEIVSVDGEELAEPAATATYTLEKITKDMTVAVVTKETGSETPDPVDTVEAVYSNEGNTSVTLPEGVEAGKAITVKVTSMPAGVWFKVQGGVLGENEGAARSASNTLTFKYTPNAADVTAGKVDFKFTGFNAIEFNNSTVTTLGYVDGAITNIEIPNITVTSGQARAIDARPGTEKQQGDYAELVTGGDAATAAPGFVDEKGLTRFYMSAGEAIEFLNRFNSLVPDEDGCVDIAIKTSSVTTNGAAAVEGKEITFDLGTPKTHGVKLPTTVTVDGKVTAKVNWFYNGTAIKADSDKIFANEEDLSKYTYQVVEPEIVAGSGLEFPVTIVCPGREEWKVEVKNAEDLEKVAVKPGDINTDNAVEGPGEDNGLKYVELTAQNKWFANYDGNGGEDAKLSEDRIKFEVGQLMGGTVGEINTANGAAKVTKADGTKVDIFFEMDGTKIKQVANWKVFYNGEAESNFLAWAKNSTETVVGDFTAAENVLLQFAKADLGKTHGTAVTAFADEPAKGVKVTTTANVYLFDAIKVAGSASELYGAKVVTHEGGKDSTADFSGNAVLPGTTMMLTGAAGTANTWTQLAWTDKDDELVTIESKLVADTTPLKYTLVIEADKAVDGTVALTETAGLYRVVIEGMTGEWFSKSGGDDITVENVPAGNYAIEYKTVAADIMTPDFGTMVIDNTKLTEANDKLGDTTNATPKADGTIEVKKAYKVELDADYVAPVGYVAQKNDVATGKTFASGDYLIPGIKAFVKVDTGVKVSSADSSMPLSLATDVSVTGKDVYSFTMPAKDVAKTVITKGSAVVFDSETNTNVVSGGVIQIPTDSAQDCTITVAITSASDKKPVITWAPFSDGSMENSEDMIAGLTTGAVNVDEENTTDSVYAWTVVLTVDGAELELGATKYMVVTIGSEKIVLPVTTQDATVLTASDITLSADSVTAETLKFGATLAADAKAHGANLSAATANDATAGTWTWCAANATPKKDDAAVTTVGKPGKYTLWIPVSAGAGYTFAGNEIDWENEAGLKVNSVAGAYDEAGYLKYTFTVAEATFGFTADGTQVTEGTAGEAYGYDATQSGASLTAAVTSAELASGASVTYKWTSGTDALIENANLFESGTAFDATSDGEQTVTVTAYIGEDAIGSATITITVSGN